jgi:hypothetical protein
MKLLNLFFVCFLVLWGTTALADPPACPAEQGVCFEDWTGEMWMFGDDPVTGAYVEGTFDADFNDFVRQNPDGTLFMHMITQELTSGFYCPPESMIPDECWPLDLELPTHGSVTGLITVDPPWFYLSCPYRVQASGYVTDPMGDCYKMMVAGVNVPSPEGGCKMVKFEITVKPQ